MSNSVVFYVALLCMLNCSGGGQAVQASLSCPHLPQYQSKIILLSLLILTTDCEDVSTINIIQVQFSCFLCQIVLHA